jgi:hypothetical protein
MGLAQLPILDPLMVYHHGVCAALGLNPENTSPLQIAYAIRDLKNPLTGTLAERERVVVWLKSCVAECLAAGDGKYANFLEEVTWGIERGEHLAVRRKDDHDTLHDGEEDGASEEPVVNGSSMSISDKPSGREG